MEDFVVMPNYFHGIITFYDTPIFNLNGKETNLSDIISKFKSLSWYKINKQFVVEPLRFHKEYVILMENKMCVGGNKVWDNGKDGKNVLHAANGEHIGNGKRSPTGSFPSFWQKSYYDHVIRDEKDLHRVREYILKNPANWEIDRLNPKFPS